MAQTCLSVLYKPGQKDWKDTKRTLNKDGVVNDNGVLNKAAALMEQANLCICLGAG